MSAWLDCLIICLHIS